MKPYLEIQTGLVVKTIALPGKRPLFKSHPVHPCVCVKKNRKKKKKSMLPPSY